MQELQHRQSSRYERQRQQARESSRKRTLEGQEIAPLPAIVNPERRAEAERSFKIFCETYFPKQFYLQWSEDHLRVIAKLEKVVNNSEQFAVAMPRGSGKTTLCLTAVLWAILTGRHSYVLLVSKNQKPEAERSMKNIQSLLLNNPLLLEDFPEAGCC